MGNLLRGKSDAGIADAEGNHGVLAAHSQCDLPWRGCIAQRIDQYVGENLHSASRVGHDLGKVLRHMDLKFQALLSKLPFKRLKRVLDEALWGNGLQGERDLTRLGSRQLLQIVHQAPEPTRFGMQHGPGAWSWLYDAVE